MYSILGIMSAIRIKIFSDFCSSEICKANFERCCRTDLLEFYGEEQGKQVFFTAGDDYTHAILLNKATPDLMIPKKNVLGLAFEPIYILHIDTDYIAYAQKHIGKYLIGDKKALPEPFVEHHGFMWFDAPEKPITEKTNVMSIVLSEKNFAPGHAYRHVLVKTIVENNLPIDVFGRGAKLYGKGPQIKGEFMCEEPYANYAYTIAIENFPGNEYFTEKLINPLMYNCMPIYIGCNNIEKHFDDSVIRLKGNINEDMKLIVNILKNPDGYYKIVERNKLLKKTNILMNMDELGFL